MNYHETIKDATGYDELLAGSEVAILTKNVTLKQGKSYRRGMLLTAKKDGGTGAIKAEQTVKDGAADYVLQSDVDATKADTVGTVYVSGRFNREKLIAAAGDTVNAHEEELRTKGIFLSSLK